MMRRVGRAQKYGAKGTASAFAIWALFRLTPKYLRTGLGWANDTIILSTHGTTHVDAPWHYAPLSEGRPARTIDQLPLQWFYGDGVVLDMRHKRHGEAITSEDIQSALAPIDYTIKPYDIVLVQTGNDRLLNPCLLQ
jgi:kynurenine formamidase